MMDYSRRSSIEDSEVPSSAPPPSSPLGLLVGRRDPPNPNGWSGHALQVRWVSREDFKGVTRARVEAKEDVASRPLGVLNLPDHRLTRGVAFSLDQVIRHCGGSAGSKRRRMNGKGDLGRVEGTGDRRVQSAQE